MALIPGRGGGDIRVTKAIWAIVFVFLMVVISAPTVIVVGFGLLPTAVAYIIDRSEQKYATFCVGGLNTCGVFPYLLKIWTDTHSVDAAFDIITDVFSLSVMFAAAGFGWMLFLSIPPVISAFLNVLAERRVQVLREVQRKIIEEWGNSVTETKTPEEEAEEAGEEAEAPDEGTGEAAA